MRRTTNAAVLAILTACAQSVVHGGDEDHADEGDAGSPALDAGPGEEPGPAPDVCGAPTIVPGDLAPSGSLVVAGDVAVVQPASECDRIARPPEDVAGCATPAPLVFRACAAVRAATELAAIDSAGHRVRSEVTRDGAVWFAVTTTRDQRMHRAWPADAAPTERAAFATPRFENTALPAGGGGLVLAGPADAPSVQWSRDDLDVAVRTGPGTVRVVGGRGAPLLLVIEDGSGQRLAAVDGSGRLVTLAGPGVTRAGPPSTSLGPWHCIDDAEGARWIRVAERGLAVESESPAVGSCAPGLARYDAEHDALLSVEGAPAGERGELFLRRGTTTPRRLSPSFAGPPRLTRNDATMLVGEAFLEATSTAVLRLDTRDWWTSGSSVSAGFPELHARASHVAYALVSAGRLQVTRSPSHRDDFAAQALDLEGAIYTNGVLHTDGSFWFERRNAPSGGSEYWGVSAAGFARVHAQASFVGSSVPAGADRVLVDRDAGRLLRIRPGEAVPLEVPHRVDGVHNLLLLGESEGALPPSEAVDDAGYAWLWIRGEGENTFARYRDGVLEPVPPRVGAPAAIGRAPGTPPLLALTGDAGRPTELVRFRGGTVETVWEDLRLLAPVMDDPEDAENEPSARWGWQAVRTTDAGPAHIACPFEAAEGPCRTTPLEGLAEADLGGARLVGRVSRSGWLTVALRVRAGAEPALWILRYPPP